MDKSARLRSALAAIALAGVFVTLSARAALFDDDEARKRIEATSQRLTQVQKQLDDRITALETQLKSQGLVELFSQVEQLKADVSKLRGQIEVLVYEQEQQQKRQRDLYVDLDSRMRKLEGGPRPGRDGRRRARAGSRSAARGASGQRGIERAKGLRRRARSVQGRQLHRSHRGVRRVREDVPEERARSVRAILARQRAVRAARFPRRDRHVSGS